MSEKNKKSNDEQLNQEVIVVEDETLRQGFTQIPNAILRMQDLSPGAKLAYMGLLSYAWQKGSCFPGQERLAEDLGVSKRSIVTYLKHLKKAGLLEVQRRGLGKTNVYVLPKIVSIDTDRLRSAHSSLQEVQDSTPLEVQNVRIEEDKVSKNTKNDKSKIRKDSPEKHEIESVDSILTRRSPRPNSEVYDEDRQVIVDFITDFAREFGDAAPVKSSTTRAYNLFKQSSLSRDAFISAMYQARSITKERSATICGSGERGSGNGVKNRMAFWFAVLSDLVVGQGEGRRKPGTGG